MVIRPVDDSGDILPVLASANLLRGVRAEAELTNDRLNLMAGDWWENPAWGNEIVEMLKETRYTEADSQTLATYLTSYIRRTPGVQDVRDALFSLEGRQFSFSCTIDTENGSAKINYEL